MKKQVGKINLTPTWRQTAAICIELLENGTAEGKEEARAEIMRMADLLTQVQRERAGSAA